ncbi:MAG TPA: FAD-dependent monooxygenase [Burkholderiales bacterium]|nr:FAD-dependent monooxygenase [Burkholderiales bacterium]
MKIAVVGGGIGGLTAALALLKRGFEVDVYEQAHELREVGAGIQISANGNRVLAALGVLEPLKELSCEASGKEIRLWSTGQTWKLFDLGQESIARYGFPYLTVYRPDLIGVLADAVRREKPDAIHLDSKLSALDAQALVLKLQNGKEAKADLIVGADGVHSRVRQALFGEGEARFTGIVAWRGTVPMERLPAHMRRRVGTNWIGPGGHVVHYPVHRGEYMNFVGVVERADWKIESWTALGSAEDCAADYAGWHDDIHRMIRGAPQLYKWALVGRAPMERWTQGRVTLLGDACHPMLPMLAQGAVMAMEDGLVLARALAEVKDSAAALERYEAARKERTRRTVLGSAENAKRFHNPRLADAQGAQEYVDREWSEPRIRERYEWLFTYDATAAPLA